MPQHAERRCCYRNTPRSLSPPGMQNVTSRYRSARHLVMTLLAIPPRRRRSDTGGFHFGLAGPGLLSLLVTASIGEEDGKDATEISGLIPPAMLFRARISCAYAGLFLSRYCRCYFNGRMPDAYRARAKPLEVRDRAAYRSPRKNTHAHARQRRWPHSATYQAYIFVKLFILYWA